MTSASGLWITLVILVAARCLAGLFAETAGWGLNVQSFLAPRVAGCLAALAIVGVTPSVARPLGTWWDRDLGRLSLPSWAAYGLAASIGFLVVACLPDRTWFLGDFQLRQGTVASGDSFERAFPQSLSLDMFLHSWLPRALGASSIESVNFVARMIGAFEAACLAMIATGFAREFSARPVVKLALASVIFFGGYLAVFTGLGKTSSELCVLTAGIGLLGVRVVRNRGGEVWLGALSAIALFLHRSAILLLPGAALALAIALKRKTGPRKSRSIVFAFILLLLALAIMAPRIGSILTDFDLPHHFASGSDLVNGRWLDTLAPRRWLDLLNIILVLSPLSIAIPVLLLAFDPEERRRDELRVLALLTLPWGIAMLLVHPQQGIFRDWDVFAPAGVAGSLLAAWCLGKVLPKARHGPAISVGVVLLTSTFALAWLIHFHDTSRGLARVREHASAGDALLSTGTDRDLEIGKAWEFLGFRHGGLGEWEMAADAFSRAVARDPHRYLYVAWGLAELGHRDFRGSESAFQALTARFPEYSLGWFGLAGVSSQTGDTLLVASALRGLRATLDTESEAREIRMLRRRYPEIWPGPLDPRLARFPATSGTR